MMLDFGEPVTLASGLVVKGIPGVASVEDTVVCENVTAGRTRTLRFASADVPDLQPTRDTLTWNGQPWLVVHVQLAGAGNVTRAFLGAP
jgi:hypothetical protein